MPAWGTPSVLDGGSVDRATLEPGDAPAMGEGLAGDVRLGALDHAPGNVRSPVGDVVEYSVVVERGVGPGVGEGAL